MDKKDISETFNHLITINERKNIILSGIKKLNSFDDSEFFVDSIMGSILIKGDNLELIKLDTFQGTLSIKGKINSVNYLDDSKKIIKYLYDTYKDNIIISIMNQYTPVCKINDFPNLNRKLTDEEYDEVIDYACSLGIENAFVQEGETQSESFIPDFDSSII